MAKDPYNPLDLKALLCFSMMAKLESLTRAGIELGISDSAVSQRIRTLENRLGTKLYEARGGRIRLTEAGRSTAAMAARIFDQISEFEYDIHNVEAQQTIVVGTSAPIIRHQLPEIVWDFRQKFPDSRLKILSQSTKRTLQMVRNNTIDLGIIPRPFQIPDDLEFRPWRHFLATILVPRNHPICANGRPSIEQLLHPELLSKHSQVVPRNDENENLRLKHGLEARGLPFNISLEVGDLDNVKHYAKTGPELAVVNGVCLARDDYADFHVIEIPKEYDSEVTYGVVVSKHKYFSKQLLSFVEMLNSSAS